MEEKEFDYAAAVAELEMLVAKVEDPETGIEDIGGCVSRAEELVTRCRTYLRQAREKVESAALLKRNLKGIHAEGGNYVAALLKSSAAK